MNRKNTYVCDNEYKNIYIYKKYICGGKICCIFKFVFKLINSDFK